MKQVDHKQCRLLRDIQWRRDGAQLDRLLRESPGRPVVLKVRQEGSGDGPILIDSADGEEDLGRLLAARGVALDRAFDAEIVVRNPLSLADLMRVRDRNDDNAVNWNGTRGTGEMAPGLAGGGALRHGPFFLRHDAGSCDLVDLYGGAGASRTLFLVLNGPSFTEEQRAALRARPGVLTFGVNNGAHAFRPHLWTSVDDPARFMRSIWEDATILKFVPMAHFEKRIRDVERSAPPAEGEPVDKDALIVRARERVRDFPSVIGFRRNHEFRPGQWLWEDTINWGNHEARGGGRSVMLVALRIAWLLGIRRVYLLGCDFEMTRERGYWFPEQRDESARRGNMNSYRILSGYFEALAPEFARAGYQIYNCNPRSGLRVFPYFPFEAALEAAAVDSTASTWGMYVRV